MCVGAVGKERALFRVQVTPNGGASHLFTCVTKLASPSPLAGAGRDFFLHETRSGRSTVSSAVPTPCLSCCAARMSEPKMSDPKGWGEVGPVKGELRWLAWLAWLTWLTWLTWLAGTEAEVWA